MSTTDTTERKNTPKRSVWKVWLLRGLLAVMCVIFGAIGWAYWKLSSSLPELSGTIPADTIEAEVFIDRDGQGVPSIRSQSRQDTAFALGFVHAQDRFFQMDLLRRVSSGRLGELVGQMALRNDRSFRRHRFESLAENVYKQLPPEKKLVVDAYAKGVNAGLDRLSATPFEYLLLGQKPKAWQATDSILVMMTMLCDLQPMDGRIELGLGELQEKVPPEVFQFLVRPGSHWDAAMDGSQLPVPPIPAAELFSMRDGRFPPTHLYANDGETDWMGETFGNRDPAADPDFVIGSNNWAVSKQVGRDAKAILASDMHLGLQVPTIWYRALMEGPTIDGSKRRVVGVTLPGAPVLIEGSNGSVAWGFTNSYGDYGDIVELKCPNNSQTEYLTAAGVRPLIQYKEELQYPGGKEDFEYAWSEWGPVVETRDGRMFVHCWIGNDPNAFDLNLMELESASTVEEALAIANRAGMPNQNVTAVDSAGNIGWTISGRIPKRSGKPPLTPVDWSDGQGVWLGYLDPSEHPRVYNPADGRIWTANNRIMGEDYLNKLGDGRFDPGARARQIRDRLFEKEQHSEQDLLAIQLDNEARFMSVWKERLLEVAKLNENKLSADFLKHVTDSSSHAAVDAVGYRIVSEFRLQVLQRIFGMEGGRGRAAGDSPGSGLAKKIGLARSVAISRDAVADQLLVERPDHWLPQGYESWNALLLDAALKSEEILAQPAGLEKATWGQRNLAKIRHPLSAAIAQLSSFLDMPELPLPGDNHMPRVQSPAGGASQRMVVSPGEEEKGIYHQPGGQSGHPLSPYYRLGYEDWVYGKASPLLPGSSEHQLKLTPKAR
jgi:penicillin amidase